MILLTTYSRPTQLLSLLKELQGNSVVVVDDGSDYDPSEHIHYCDYYRTPHRGKPGFWMQWELMFEIAKESTDDWFLFLQDDFYNVQLDEIKRQCNALEGKYAFNIANIGGNRGWTSIKRKDLGDKWLSSYVDCKFATNRQSLEAIGWQIDEVPITRFNAPNISSGVGEQLSKKFAWQNVTMYTPKKSLAKHSQGESKMHPQERKINPLVSK